MADKALYFIPGFMGTDLVNEEDRWLWPNPVVVGVRGLWPFNLNAAGTAPAPALPGRPRTAGELCKPGIAADLKLVFWMNYKPLMTVMDAIPGYLLTGFIFDWRTSLLAEGDRLAGLIESAAYGENPATLVAHSMGGLVARLAWRNLVGKGKSNLIRRIVTIGTPHWGTYAALDLMVGNDDDARQVMTVRRAYVLDLLFEEMGKAEMCSIIRSWPGLYQLLPSLLAPDAFTDPMRSRIFDPVLWSGRVNAAHLASASTSFQPIMNEAATKPPSTVLTAVAGTGMPTAGRIRTLVGIDPALWFYTEFEDGDGRVTTASASFDDATRYWQPGSHVGIVKSEYTMENIRKWIEEETFIVPGLTVAPKAPPRVVPDPPPFYFIPQTDPPTWSSVGGDP